MKRSLDHDDADDAAAILAPATKLGSAAAEQQSRETVFDAALGGSPSQSECQRLAVGGSAEKKSQPSFATAADPLALRSALNGARADAVRSASTAAALRTECRVLKKLAAKFKTRAEAAEARVAHVDARLAQVRAELAQATERALCAERDAAKLRMANARLKSDMAVQVYSLSPVSSQSVEHDQAAEAAAAEEQEAAVANQLDIGLDREDAARDADDAVPATMADAVAPSAPKLVALTGFADGTSDLQYWGRQVEALGGRVAEQGELSPSVTHVVLNSATKGRPYTMKTIAAKLLHVWVVSEKWISESMRAGRWVDEAPFGSRSPTTDNPLAGKHFFLHRDFVGTKRCNSMLLIEYGHGVVRDGPKSMAKECDYRLVPSTHKNRAPNDLTWKEFLALLGFKED